MKMCKSQLRFFVVLLFVGVLFSCSEVLDEDPNVDSPYNFDIQGSDRMIVGETMQLTVDAGSRASSESLTLIWDSANKTVATVDDKGVVTARAAGKALISVTDKKNTNNSSVFMVEVEANTYITALVIEGPHVLGIGQSGQLKAVTLPPELNTQPLSWTSENPDVATVDSNGLVTAGMSTGETRIMVKTLQVPEGKPPVVSSYPIKVVDFVITTETSKDWLTKGEEFKLSVSLNDPSNVTRLGTPVWTSSHPEIGSVSADGVVTAHTPGIFTITVEDKALGLSASQVLYVVELEIQAETHIVETESTLAFSGVIVPAGSSLVPKLFWGSDPLALGQINGETGVLTTASSAGTLLVFVDDDVSELSAEYEVEITEVHAESIGVYGASELLVGSDTSLQFKIFPEDAVQTEIIWKSANESIATVDLNSGVVTGVAPGETSITAKVGGLDISTTHKVKVLPIEAEDIAIFGDTRVEIGRNIQLTSAVFPQNATYRDVRWKSTNENIATVDPYSGVVEGEALGTVEILAMVEQDPDVQESITVTVAPVTIESIVIAGSEYVHKSGAAQLSARVEPETATEKAVIWKSSREQVASVDQSGKVKGRVVGTTTITAEAIDGSGVLGELPVTVYDILLVKSLPRMMVVGQTIELGASVMPVGLDVDVNISWLNKNTDIVEITNDGKVTAKAYGPATVGFFESTTNDSDWTTTTVVDLILDGRPSSLLRRGDTVQLSGDIYPLGFVDADIAWSSSNESIATVSSKGLVAAKGGFGIATITAYDRTTGATAEHTIIVRDMQASGPRYIKVGESADSVLDFTPQHVAGHEFSLEWSSSNPDVVKVDPETGVITGVTYDVGNPITITAQDTMGLSSSYIVEVAPVPVIMEWDVRSGDTVGLPIRAERVTFLVDWEDDGSYVEVRTFNDSHKYTSGGKKRITITTNDDRVDLSDWNIAAFTTVQSRFTDVLQWGDAYFKNSNGAFSKAQKLVRFSAEDSPTLEGAVTKMFAEAKQFTGEGIGHWDMSKVTGMNNMFYWTDSFLGEEIGDWDVSSVTDMSYMFRYASKFVGTELSNWDTRSLENMTWTFAEASVFNGDIGSWDVSKVTNMSYAVARSPRFLQDLSSWVVDKDLPMNGAFVGTGMGTWGYIDYHPVNCHKCQAGHW